MDKLEKEIDKNYQKFYKYYMNRENENKNIENRYEKNEIKKKYKNTLNNIKKSLQEDKDDKFPVDGNVYKGSQIFSRFCGSCHNLSNNDKYQLVAPDIGSLYGNMVSSKLNYNYSKPISSRYFRWNSTRLYSFINNPQKYIKGNNCLINKGKGLKNEEEIIDLIEFLKKFSIELDKYEKNKHNE